MNQMKIADTVMLRDWTALKDLVTDSSGSSGAKLGPTQDQKRPCPTLMQTSSQSHFAANSDEHQLVQSSIDFPMVVARRCLGSRSHNTTNTRPRLKLLLYNGTMRPCHLQG